MPDQAKLDKGFAVTEKLWGRRSGLQPGAGEPENAKDLAALVTEHCFADSWSRPGLDIKTKSMLTLAILTTLGAHNELRGHVRGALNLGITKEQIVELFIHTLAYAGTPRTVGAYSIAREIFQQDAGKK